MVLKGNVVCVGKNTVSGMSYRHEGIRENGYEG